MCEKNRSPDRHVKPSRHASCNQRVIEVLSASSHQFLYLQRHEPPDQQFSRRNMFRLIIEWRESLAGHLCLLHLSAPCSICNRSPSGWQLRRAIHPCPAAPKITVSHITANRPAATIYAFLNTCTFHRKHSSRPVGQLAGSHSAMPLTETWAFGNLLALSLQAF
jgi:hypothetical protein